MVYDKSNETDVAKLTVKEFIKLHRPDGKGHMGMTDFEGNVIFDEEFDEIICDLCNANIEQPMDEDGEVDEEKKVVFMIEGGRKAICEDCYKRWEAYDEYPEDGI